MFEAAVKLPLNNQAKSWKSRRVRNWSFSCCLAELLFKAYWLKGMFHTIWASFLSLWPPYSWQHHQVKSIAFFNNYSIKLLGFGLLGTFYGHFKCGLLRLGLVFADLPERSARFVILWTFWLDSSWFKLKYIYNHFGIFTQTRDWYCNKYEKMFKRLNH